MSTDTSPSRPTQDLSWLLEDFRSRVPGVICALLASNDGLKLAQAALAQEYEADTAAAVMAGLHSLAKGVGRIKNTSGAIRQIVVEMDDVNLFLMSAGLGLPRGILVQLGTDPSTVGTVLGVLTHSDADPGVVGYEMATLIKSVAEHLVTPTRQSAPPASAGQ